MTPSHLSVDNRNATTWPVHKAKARARKSNRSRIAREAQQLRDREASKSL